MNSTQTLFLILTYLSTAVGTTNANVSEKTLFVRALLNESRQNYPAASHDIQTASKTVLWLQPQHHAIQITEKNIQIDPDLYQTENLGALRSLILIELERSFGPSQNSQLYNCDKRAPKPVSGYRSICNTLLSCFTASKERRKQRYISSVNCTKCLQELVDIAPDLTKNRVCTEDCIQAIEQDLMHGALCTHHSDSTGHIKRS